METQVSEDGGRSKPSDCEAYANYHRLLSDYLTSKFGRSALTKEDALDISSDVFIDLLKRIRKTYEQGAEPLDDIYAYARSVAKYRALGVLKEKKRYVAYDDSYREDAEKLVQEGVTSAVSPDILEFLKNSGLSERHARFLELHYFEGKSLREIADCWSHSYGYMRKYSYIVRKRTREVLLAYCKENDMDEKELLGLLQ